MCSIINLTNALIWKCIKLDVKSTINNRLMDYALGTQVVLNDRFRGDLRVIVIVGCYDWWPNVPTLTECLVQQVQLRRSRFIQSTNLCTRSLSISMWRHCLDYTRIPFSWPWLYKWFFNWFNQSVGNTWIIPPSDITNNMCPVTIHGRSGVLFPL